MPPELINWVECKKGGTSCVEWIKGNSDNAPNHVCGFTAQQSTEQYAWERTILARFGKPNPNVWVHPSVLNRPLKFPALFDDAFLQTFAYLIDWPLPLGAGAIEVWYRDRARRKWDSDENKWPPPYPPLALVDQQDAMLGLAVKREIGDRTMWLLGLVARTDSPEQSARTMQVNMAGFDGTHYTRQEWWQFIDPIITLPSLPSDRQSLRRLDRERNTLLKWYKQTLLGKIINNPGGRPKGTTEAFRDKDDFFQTTLEAYRAVKATGDYPSQERIAEQLERMGRLGVRNFRRGRVGGDVLPQFKKQRKDLGGYNTWNELVEELEEHSQS